MSTKNKGIFLVILILMSAAGLVASDICLPALPEMASYFDCQQTGIQLSVAFSLCALAISQLIYGILSDRFGPKIILICAFMIFTMSSLLSVFAVTLSQFIFCRILQAIGAGAGSVLTRVLIIDRFSKEDAVKVFTTIFPVIGLSPAIAPFIGGYLTHFFDWRASFYVMAAYGLIVLCLVLFCLGEEPKLKKGNNNIEGPYGYQDIFKNFSFLGYALILCISYAVFRCYTTESPFVFDNQGFAVQEIGYFYITLSVAYVLGNLGAKRLATQLSVDKSLSVGFLFFVSGGVLLATFSYLFSANPLAIIIPMSIITVGNGFLFPVGSAAAMSSVPNHCVGMASGLLGSLQLSIAALSVYCIGGVSGGNAFFMALYLLGMISCGFFSFMWMVYRVKRKVKDKREWST